MWNARTICLLIGSILVEFGTWIDVLTILTMCAYAYKVNSFTMAMTSGLFLLPMIFFGRRIGQYIDRKNNLYILPATLALRALTAGLILFKPPLIIFLLLGTARAAFSVPVDPACNVLVSRVIPKEQVQSYFGVLGGLRNVSKILAPTLGTAVASIYGESCSLVLSISIVLVGMAFLFSVQRTSIQDNDYSIKANPIPAPQRTDTTTQSTPKDPNTILLLILTIIFALTVFFINNQLPILLRNGGFNKALLGILVSSSGIGGIIGAATLSRSKFTQNANELLRLIFLTVLGNALLFALMGAAFLMPRQIAPYLAASLFFCTGFVSSAQTIFVSTLTVTAYRSAVGTLSARVASLRSVAMLIAPWLSAALLPILSMGQLFILDGISAMIVLLIVRFVLYKNQFNSAYLAGC